VEAKVSTVFTIGCTALAFLFSALEAYLCTSQT